MPRFFFTPLYDHFDLGFGATGDAFRDAATALLEKDQNAFQNGRIPICFLYRHAIELYLKSVILIIHKRLRIPFGESRDTTPKVYTGDDWIAFEKVHRISMLYKHFKALVTGNEKMLSRIAKTNWAKIPPELEQQLSKVDRIDQNSTFFRYPTTKNPRQDSAKSAFKKAKEKKLMNRLKSGESKITAYLIVNDNHEVLESYQLDDNSLKDSLDCLKAACDTLSGAHMGMRMELANGH